MLKLVSCREVAGCGAGVGKIKKIKYTMENFRRKRNFSDYPLKPMMLEGRYKRYSILLNKKKNGAIILWHFELHRNREILI